MLEHNGPCVHAEVCSFSNEFKMHGERTDTPL